MNDEETVALIAGGHTFGKAHGAGHSDTSLGRNPLPREWKSRASAGTTVMARVKALTPITGGPEVTWTTTPTKWSNNFFENLFSYEWELTKSPAGAQTVGGKEWGRCRYNSGCVTIRPKVMPHACLPPISP